MHWFLMLGGIPPALVECGNEHIRDVVARAEQRPPREERHPAPKLSIRNLAASRGEEMPARTGVQHKRPEGYLARKYARLLDKQIEREVRAYRAGNSQMSSRQWRILCAKREDVMWL